MRLENNLKLFISKSDLIIANRYSRELKYSKKFIREISLEEIKFMKYFLNLNNLIH